MKKKDFDEFVVEHLGKDRMVTGTLKKLKGRSKVVIKGILIKEPEGFAIKNGRTVLVNHENLRSLKLSDRRARQKIKA